MFSPLLNEFCSHHSILWLQTIFVRLPRSVHLRHRWPGIFGKHHQDPGQETSRQIWYLREAGPVWRQILASQLAPFLLPTSCSTLRPTAGFWWKLKICFFVEREFKSDPPSLMWLFPRWSTCVPLPDPSPDQTNASSEFVNFTVFLQGSLFDESLSKSISLSGVYPGVRLSQISMSFKTFSRGTFRLLQMTSTLLVWQFPIKCHWISGHSLCNSESNDFSTSSWF